MVKLTDKIRGRNRIADLNSAPQNVAIEPES